MLEKLQRYFEDKSDEAESDEVKQWLVDNAGTRASDSYMSEIYKDLKPGQDSAATERALERLRPRLNNRPEKKRGMVRRLATVAAAAAAVLIAVMLTARIAGERDGLTEWLEAYAPYGDTLHVRLSDGSVFLLNSGTKLIYPAEFGPLSRQVYVAGEVFADIAHDSKRPFTVSAAEVNVKVLGTKFNLKSYIEDRQAEVHLVEGSVDFETTFESRTSSLRLSPGEAVRFEKETGTTEVYEFMTDYYMNWSEGRVLIFSDEKLSQIATELERRFGVRIIIEDQKLAEMRYYVAFINNESIDQILDIINSHSRMKITRRGDNYYITSR